MNVSNAAAGTVGARLVVFVFAAITGLLIARLLGPTDRGVFAVLTTAVLILHAIGLLGIESANLYYTARGSSISGLVTNSLAVSMVISILLAGAFLFLLQVTEEGLFPGATLFAASVAVIGLPLSLLHSYLMSILWGQSRVVPVNVLSVAAAVIQLAAIAAVYVLFDVGVVELLAIMQVVAALGVAAILYLLWQTPGAGITLSIDLGLMRRMVRFSRAAYGANLFAMIATRVDILFVSAMVGGAAVGHYAVAVALSQMMLLIPQSVQRVLFVRFSGSSPDETNRLLPMALRIVLFLMISLALAAALVASPVVRLALGPEYAPTATLYILLLPGMIATSMSSIMSSYFTGRGRPDVPMRVSFVILVAVIGLDLVLIPMMGATGAALALSGAYIIGASFQLVVVLQWTKSNIRDALLTRMGDLRYIRSHLQIR